MVGESICCLLAWHQAALLPWLCVHFGCICVPMAWLLVALLWMAWHRAARCECIIQIRCELHCCLGPCYMCLEFLACVLLGGWGELSSTEALGHGHSLRIVAVCKGSAVHCLLPNAHVRRRRLALQPHRRRRWVNPFVVCWHGTRLHYCHGCVCILVASVCPWHGYLWHCCGWPGRA